MIFYAQGLAHFLSLHVYVFVGEARTKAGAAELCHGHTATEDGGRHCSGERQDQRAATCKGNLLLPLL